MPDIWRPNTCAGGEHFRYLCRNARNDEWASEGEKSQSVCLTPRFW